jgi:hypothetical protein
MNHTNTATRPANQISTVPLFGMQESQRSWSVERLLPEQFFVPAWESEAVWTGERRLLCAVLQEAVHAFLKYREVRTVRGHRLFREAQEWFWSEQCDGLYAFESICRHLHLDPDYIRQGLQRGQRPSGSLPHSVRLEQGGKAQPSQHCALTRAPSRGDDTSPLRVAKKAEPREHQR